MTDYTPPAGWTEIPAEELAPDAATERLAWSDRTGTERVWVLIPPPVLPTVPGTLIRVESATVPGEWLLSGPGWTRPGTDVVLAPGDLQAALTGYEIRSEPRATTATAVLADTVSAIPSALAALGPVADRYGATLPAPQAPSAPQSDEQTDGQAET